MKKLLLRSVAFLLFISSFHVYGQTAEKWNVSVSGGIIWQEVTSYGTLIVCTNQGLMGVNPESGTVEWKNTELANIPRQSVEFSMAKPIITVNKGETVLLIDQFAGTLLFDTRAHEIVDIALTRTLTKSGGLFIVGNTTSPKEFIIALVNTSTGEVIWKKRDKFGRIIDVYELNDSELILVTLYDNIKLKTQTGDQVWKVANSAESEKMNNMGAFGSMMKNIGESMAEDMDFEIRFYKDPYRDVFYVASENENTSGMGDAATVSYSNSYQAFNTNDGKRLWSKPLELSGKLGQIAFEKSGLIILPNDETRTKINMFDYDSQEGFWGKKGRGLKIKGGIYDYIETNNGYVLVSERNGKNYLTFLDIQLGTLPFEDLIKIDGQLQGVVASDKGVLYVTTEEVNIMDVNSGTLVLDKSIPTQPALTAQKGDKLYVFDTKDDVLKSIDLKSGVVANVSSKEIKFEGKEMPASMELRDGGIVLSSEQNVTMISYSGQVVYQTYVPAPKESGWKQALLYAQAVRASYIGANAYYASAAFKSVQDEAYEKDAVSGAMVEGLGTAYESLGDQASDFAVNSFKKASQRFKATTEGRDFMVMLGQVDKSIVLKKINKDSGKEEGVLDIGKNRTPQYAIDDVTGMVYLQEGENTIKAYQF